MIEQFKDLCVIKCYDISDNIVNQCEGLAKIDGINLVVYNDADDCKISIQNLTASEVDFQSVVDKTMCLVKQYCYCDCDKSLEECLVELAIDKNIKLACAESITGGMVSSSIVNVPGSSAVLSESYITYSNASKVRLLHVKSSTLEIEGAVSKSVALQMAMGVLVNKDINITITTTGCAGPDSDEMGAPVGLVYIGYGNKNNLKVEECYFDGSRNYIRKRVVNKALYLALQFIKNNY